MTRKIVGWLVFWWIPVVGIRWSGKRWIQHDHHEIPEPVLVAGGLIWVTILASVLIALTLMAMGD